MPTKYHSKVPGIERHKSFNTALKMNEKAGKLMCTGDISIWRRRIGWSRSVFDVIMVIVVLLSINHIQ